MQMNDYDWFDHYDAEKNGVPEITSEEIAADAVAKRVQEQLGITIKPMHSLRRRTWTRWVAGAAAAAVLVTGGTMLSVELKRFSAACFPKKCRNIRKKWNRWSPCRMR